MRSVSSFRSGPVRGAVVVQRRDSSLASQRRPLRCLSLKDDVTQGFFDLARLVASDKSTHKSAFEDLAYAIGRDAYADLNGWHLFLKDMSTMPGGPKMHQLLAEHLGDKILTSGFDDRDVEDFLKKVPVKLGQGKASVSLDAVLPSAAVSDIVRACKEWAKDQ